MTLSICSTCDRKVDGAIVFDDGAWVIARCPQHGYEKVFSRDDLEETRVTHLPDLITDGRVWP